MAIYTNNAGLTMDETKVGVKSAADWSAQGFSLVNSAPPVAPSTPYVGSDSSKWGVSQAITPEKMQPEVKAPVITPVAETVDTAGAAVAGAGQTAKTLQDYIKEATPEPTTTDKALQDLLNNIAAGTEKLESRGTDQLTIEQELGIPTLKKNLADINAQILSKTAEFEKLSASVEGKGMNISNVLGQQGAIRKQAASEIGLLQARALGLQGQTQIAQETANRAIDLKYQSVEARIATQKAQIEALMPMMDKEEKIRAEARLAMLKDQEKKEQDKKDAEKQTFELQLKGYTKLTPSGLAGLTENDILRLPNGDIYRKPNEAVINMQNKYPDAGILPTDSISIATAKMQRSKIYQDQIRPPDGGTPEEKVFFNDINSIINDLTSGKKNWGQAFNYIKAKWGTPDDIIDNLLDKEIWAVEGAYEKQLASRKEATTIDNEISNPYE